MEIDEVTGKTKLVEDVLGKFTQLPLKIASAAADSAQRPAGVDRGRGVLSHYFRVIRF